MFLVWKPKKLCKRCRRLRHQCDFYKKDICARCIFGKNFFNNKPYCLIHFKRGKCCECKKLLKEEYERKLKLWIKI